MKINILQAFNGDSIWISIVKNEQKLNILIDGGTSTTYSYKDKGDGKIKRGDLQKLIAHLKTNNEKLDLVILTHIDDDHIDGFLKWFGKDETAILNIKEIWFNSGRTIKKYLNDIDSKVDSVKFIERTSLTSVRQGVDFENFIRDKAVWDEKVITPGEDIDWNGITFRVLSPGKQKLEKLLQEWTKKNPDSTSDTSRKNDYKKTLKDLIEEDSFEEDSDAYNGSSIAFILKNEDKEYLFLGDSHPSEIVSGLHSFGYAVDNRLNAELLKLSHHGSKKNTSAELLNLVNTDKYIISTNGDIHSHPDKTTVARIVNRNPNAKIYFNYPKLISKIVLEKDKADFPNVGFFGVESL